jgi:hypothetical protein
VGTVRLVALLTAGVLALVVASVTYSDESRADTARVIVRVTPPILPADNAAQATVTLRYLDGDGTPRAGDELDLLDVSQSTGTILRDAPGVIPAYRLFTDARGQATFRYIAPMSNPFVATLPAHIQVTDRSFGTILEIDKTTIVTINVVDPSKLKGGQHGAHGQARPG